MADPRPFLKWVGGKTQLLPELMPRVPKWYQTYREPFVGGGALFFALRPVRAVLSDINLELVTAYRAVRDDVEEVVGRLHDCARFHGPELYERMRREPFRPAYPFDAAARMIYLNKTCFNGLYRVNAKGEFNTPMGKFKTPPTICDEANLRACSEALRHAKIEAWDFQYAIRRATKGDVVYCDPPYIPSSETADFTSYSADGFTLKDHEALAWSCGQAKRDGVHVILSSAGNGKGLEVYREFEIHRAAERRAVNSKTTGRGAVRSFICT